MASQKSRRIREDRLTLSNDWPHDEGTCLQSQDVVKKLIGAQW
jgi:hypothetical protein